MRHSTAPRRLLALATLTAVVGGMIGVSAPALAGSPPKAPLGDFGLHVAQAGGGHVSGIGTRGMVDPKKLPQRTESAKPHPTKPFLSRPLTAQGPRTVHPSGVGPPDPVEATATTNPPVGQAGVDGFFFGSGPNTSNEPPDPWVAAGPDHIIQTVNTSMQILDRSGNLIQAVDLAAFFQLPNGFGQSDPRVIFDSLHQRWVMTEVSWQCTGAGTGGIGYADYMVSSTADPTDPWRLDYIYFNDYLPDYPAPGTSTANLAIGSNLFSMDTVSADCLNTTPYAGADILVFDWAEIIRPLPAPANHFDELFGGDTFFTPRIAVQAPATSAALQIVMQEGTAPALPHFLQLTGSAAAVGGVIITAESDLAADGVVAPWVEPTFPQQPGVTPEVTRAIDSRPTDAIWQANKLSWVSTQGCTPTGDLSLQDCVRVTQVNTTGAVGATPPSALQDFLIAEANTDNYYGGIGQALDGTLHVVWTKSDTTSIYPSSYAAYQLPADASNSLSPLELLKAGSTSSSFIGTRWGDYNGVSQDPQVPNAVWQANMYSGGGFRWNTFVSQLQTGGSSYVGIAPLRVVDSRTPLGVSGIFNVNVPRTFQVGGVGGVSGIPIDAVAVTGNVTVTGQTSAGFVAITPTAVVNPTSSTINVPLGDTRANNFTVPLAGNGKLAAVFKASSAGQKAHVIVDITGYFLAGETHATYNTLPPVRLMDTRAGPGHVGPLATFHAGTSQQLPVAGFGGVPANAVAITANLTITGQTKAGLLSVTPAMPSGPPTSSTLNAPLGDTRANGLTAQLNGGGGIWITYSTTGAATADVLLDVTGYYLQDNTGLLFFPLTPGRILDSRPGAVLSGLSGLFTSSGPRPLDTDGHWGAPSGAAAVTGNLTVVGQTAAGFLAITPASDPAPTTSTMNFPLGDIRANGVTVPLNGSGNMYLVYRTTAAGKKTHVLLDLSGYFK